MPVMSEQDLAGGNHGARQREPINGVYRRALGVLKMFRFTIRDMFWLTMIFGFCLHAWTERFSRDVAWRRRVTEESAERADAVQRAKEAESIAKIADERAGKYAQAARQFQNELFWQRHPGSFELIFHNDGTVTGRPFGGYLRQLLTPEELMPWMELAQHRIEGQKRERDAMAKDSSAEPPSSE
jgi:hypothetical protein